MRRKIIESNKFNAQFHQVAKNVEVKL